MKKVLSLVLVLSMVLGTFSFAFAAPMSDVAGTEYEEAVTRLSSLGVLNGFPDGTFRPDATITRAQFAKTIVSVLGLENAANAATGLSAFSDVATSHWAAGYINIASRMGYIKGFTDGSFRPEEPITYEQAVTLVVRALGYEQAAEQRGGYPYGYLVVGAEEGVTDDVNGVSGLPASRGVVAQLVDNSLEVAMMVQVGYGSDTKWVVSGTEDTDEVTLLDKLGYERVDEDTRVVSYDADDSEITLESKDVYVVGDDFDYEAVLGLELTLWVDGDDVIVYTVEDEPLFDALDWDADDEELTLVTAEEDYAVNEDALLFLDGDKVKVADADDLAVAEYAKVVLNDDEEVVFVNAYTWDGFYVVKEVEDEMLYAYGDDELDVEDFTLVKDGKTIAIEDLEDGDVFFYNEDEAYAEVFNSSVEAEIDRIYSDTFKVDGTVYAVDGTFYLDEEDYDALTITVLEDMQDVGEVEVFVDREGDAAVVVGEQGEADTSSFYALLQADSTTYSAVRSNDLYYTLDVLTEAGETEEYDLTESDIDEYEGLDGVTTGSSAWFADMDTEDDAPVVVEITVDEDGDVTEVAKLAMKNVDEEVKTDAVYAEGWKLQGSAVVFMAEGYSAVEDYDVTTWEDAADDFNKLDDETADKNFVYGKSDKVVVMVVGETDANSDTETVRGLVYKVRELNDSDEIYEISVEVAGEATSYLTEADKVTGLETGSVSYFADLTVGDKTEEVTSVTEVTPAAITIAEDGVSTSSKTITDGTTTYRLVSDAVIYDEDDDIISLRDLNDGDVVEVYVVEGTTKYVDYVRVTTPAADVEEGSNEDVTFEYTSSTAITVDGIDVTTTPSSFMLKISGDALEVAVYTDTVDFSTVADDQEGVFDISSLITANGVYKVELVNIKAPTNAIASDDMYLRAN